jgi:hypothetical protein
MALPKKARKKQRSPRGTDKKQSERFKETARELGADMSFEDFKQTFQKLIPSKRGRDHKT